MAATYELLLTDPFGNALAALDRFAACTYTRTVNDIGQMTLTVPANSYDPSLFQPDGRIYINRALPGQVPTLDMETCWFIRDLPSYPMLDAQGAEVIQVDCQDAMMLLDTRVVAYNEGDATTLKLAAGDDMAKAVVRENMGALATDTARDLSAYMTVQADAGKAQSLHMAFARRVVLDVLKEFAQASWNLGTYLAFDVVVSDPRTGLLEFRTYTGARGVDHRAPSGNPPVILDPASGNLANVTVAQRYRDEKTYVYVLGQGLGTIRAVQPVSDSARINRSPFNRREMVVNASSSSDPDVLLKEGNAALKAGRPLGTFTADIVEQADTLRGVHWNLGDQVTVNYKNLAFDARVDKVGVALQNSKSGVAESTATSFRIDS